MNFTAAARKTTTGTKVYVHTNCDCTKVNGKVLKGIETVDAAEQYADDMEFAFTLCKTSQVEDIDQDEEGDEDEDGFDGLEATGETEFELVVDNTDQYGKQRRDAVAKLVEILGGEITCQGIKNKHRTGNAAFRVMVTGAPRTLQPLAESFLSDIEEQLEDIVDEAKSEGIANGWDSNTRQKHYKATARQYITEQGAELAAKLA